MTPLDDPGAGETIAALTTAMANAVSAGEAGPLSIRDLHVLFVSAPTPEGGPAWAAARVLQRGHRSAHVEAQLKTQRGELIAFAVSRLDTPDPFEARTAAVAPAPAKRGLLRTIWGMLEEMSA
jgi:hypothetical protein